MTRNKKITIYRIAVVVACTAAVVAAWTAIDIRAMDKKKGQ